MREIVEKIEYSSLEYYQQYSIDIPEANGIYFWVYWPFKDSNSKENNYKKLLEKIEKYSKTNLNLPVNRNLSYKYSVEVKELMFKNDTIFGLSPEKKDILLDYLKKSSNNEEHFLKYFKKIAFKKPFYIGKATNLRLRLEQHFNKKTEILNNLEELDIDFSEILIGYETLVQEEGVVGIDSVFEEITQRIIKPGLTKRVG